MRILKIVSQKGRRRKKTRSPEEMKKGETQRNASGGGTANGKDLGVKKGCGNGPEGGARVRATGATGVKLGGGRGHRRVQETGPKGKQFNT